MTNAFDPRIVRVGISINNDLQIFEGLDIRIQGQKFASTESSACLIKISNLTRTQKNFIMTTASPMTISNNPNRMPIPVTVGRQSYGTFRLFEGTCWASGVTEPPDIGILLQSTTQNLSASLMNSVNLGALSSLQTISQSIANMYGLTLNFTAAEKQVANFNYTGGLQSAINKLARCADVRVHIDNKVLNVFNIGSTRGGIQPFVLSLQNSMVGIPEATQSGVKARMLIRPEPQIGGPITINSLINPAVNGSYFISTMNFNIASRDDQPVWDRAVHHRQAGEAGNG
jgi:hypothetical protein